MKISVQDVKDKMHDYLVSHSRFGTGGCQVFTGCIQKKTGLGIIGLHGRKYTAHRIAAWVYLGKFKLNDRRVKVHRQIGCVPECVNPEHLIVAKLSEKQFEARRRKLKKKRSAALPAEELQALF